MTNDTQQISTEEKKPIPFGTRLKNAREALGLDRKEAAAQLRLSEKVILMMEKDRYPADLPVTFIRGYIRAYGKLLQIPEYEIKKAIEPIKAKPTPQYTSPQIKPTPVTSGNYFMQIFTYLIMFTMIGLVGVWWYTHTTSTQPITEAALNTEVNTATQTPPQTIDNPPLKTDNNNEPIAADNTDANTNKENKEVKEVKENKATAETSVTAQNKKEPTVAVVQPKRPLAKKETSQRTPEESEYTEDIEENE